MGFGPPGAAPSGVGDCFAHAVRAAAAGGRHGMAPCGGVPVRVRKAQPGVAAFPSLGSADGGPIGLSEILACGGRWICGRPCTPRRAKCAMLGALWWSVISGSGMGVFWSVPRHQFESEKHGPLVLHSEDAIPGLVSWAACRLLPAPCARKHGGTMGKYSCR